MEEEDERAQRRPPGRTLSSEGAPLLLPFYWNVNILSPIITSFFTCLVNCSFDKQSLCMWSNKPSHSKLLLHWKLQKGKSSNGLTGPTQDVSGTRFVPWWTYIRWFLYLHHLLSREWLLCIYRFIRESHLQWQSNTYKFSALWSKGNAFLLPHVRCNSGNTNYYNRDYSREKHYFMES